MIKLKLNRRNIWETIFQPSHRDVSFIRPPDCLTNKSRMFAVVKTEIYDEKPQVSKLLQMGYTENFIREGEVMEFKELEVELI